MYQPGFTPQDSQADDLRVLAENNYTGLLNIQTGYGKTILSCMVGAVSGAEVVLVIAPKSTHRSAWAKDVALVTGAELRVVGNKNKAQKSALSDLEFGVPGWYIITPQLFTRSDSSHWRGDLLIVDEIHQLGNPGSVGQRKLSGYDDDDGEPLSHRFTHRLALSATPARNNFDRVWSVMRFLWPELSQRGQVASINHWQWCLDRMTHEVVYTGKKDNFGNHITATEWKHEEHPGRLFSEAPCVIQHFKREQCCRFHPKGFMPMGKPRKIERDVELHADQKRILKELEDQSLAWLEDNPLVIKFPLTMHQRLRQVALGVPKLIPSDEVGRDGEPKWNLIYDPDCKSPVVDEVLAIAAQLDEEPFVVFVESQKFAEVLVHRLNKRGIPTAEYSGRRKADLSGFGHTYRALVGVLAAIGTGTDGLQRITNNEVWVQRSLDETVNEQAEGRTDRSGQTRQVQRYYVQDDLGMFYGQLTKSIERRMTLNRSLRKDAR